MPTLTPKIAPKPTLREILELAKTATEDELDAPIEIAVRTYTSRHTSYPDAFAVQMSCGRLRILAAYEEDVSVHRQKKRQIT